MTFILRWFVGIGRGDAGLPYTRLAGAADQRSSGKRLSRYDISEVSAAHAALLSECVHVAKDELPSWLHKPTSYTRAELVLRTMAGWMCATGIPGGLVARQCFESSDIAVESSALRARRRHWRADMDAEANKDS